MLLLVPLILGYFGFCLSKMENSREQAISSMTNLLSQTLQGKLSGIPRGVTQQSMDQWIAWNFIMVPSVSKTLAVLFIEVLAEDVNVSWNNNEATNVQTLIQKNKITLDTPMYVMPGFGADPSTRTANTMWPPKR